MCLHAQDMHVLATKTRKNNIYKTLYKNYSIVRDVIFKLSPFNTVHGLKATSVINILKILIFLRFSTLEFAKRKILPTIKKKNKIRFYVKNPTWEQSFFRETTHIVPAFLSSSNALWNADIFYLINHLFCWKWQKLYYIFLATNY